MNSRTLIIFIVIFTLIAGGIYFSRAMENYAAENKEKWQPQAVNGATDIKVYSLEEVATHDTVESCWAAIDGKVYDLTAWINEHPGGPDRIIGICGSDATEAFVTQHATSNRAAEELTALFIGNVASK